MPGSGRAELRNFTADELSGLAGNKLGERTLDVYLNGSAYWRNVPEPVWEYIIGGYQVLKKWLSYREQPILGRPLTTVEAREVTSTVRRIAAVVMLEPQLDENYRAAAGAPYKWNHRVPIHAVITEA